MDIYNRCKLIPCKQCWRSLQEGVSVSQTQKPLQHTLGGKADFSQQELQPLLHSQGKGATEKTPCTKGVLRAGGAQGIPKDWELSWPGFILSAGFIFHAEEAEKPPCSSYIWRNPSGTRGSHPNSGFSVKNGNKGRGRGKMNCTRQCTNHSFSEQDTKIYLFVSLWNNLKYSSHNIYFYNPVIFWAYRIFKPCQKSYLDWILKEREKSIAAVNDDIFQWAEI